MNGLLWTSGHLSWGVFALIVFTGFWWLLFDLFWRLFAIRIGWLFALMAIGWVTGVGFILFSFHLIGS